MCGMSVCVCMCCVHQFMCVLVCVHVYCLVCNVFVCLHVFFVCPPTYMHYTLLLLLCVCVCGTNCLTRHNIIRWSCS